jgi:hypothetical protein
MTDLHRAGQILWDTVQSCTARHPSVTSVALWTSVQLCQGCPDLPGLADAPYFIIILSEGIMGIIGLPDSFVILSFNWLLDGALYSLQCA